jgi:hypothetical protein
VPIPLNERRNREGQKEGKIAVNGKVLREFHFIGEREWNEVDRLFSNRIERELNTCGGLIGRMSLRDDSLGLPDVIPFDELRTLSESNRSGGRQKRWPYRDKQRDRQKGGKCIVE